MDSFASIGNKLLPIVVAAVALWSASFVLCFLGELRYVRQKAAEYEASASRLFDYADAAESRYLRSREDIATLRAALFELERDNLLLRGTFVTLRGPDHLGRRVCIDLTLPQWRLIEDVMSKEARIQRRPLDQYVVVTDPKAAGGAR